MKQRRKWFDEEVYNASVLFIVGGTFEEAVELMKNYDVIDVLYSNEDYARYGFTQVVYPNNHKKGFAFKVVWWDGVTPSALAHEIVHLALFILDDAGVELSRNNSEALAYYVDYWYRKFDKFATTKEKSPK